MARSRSSTSTTARPTAPRPNCTRLMAQHPWLRRVRHKQSCGQSAAVRTGVAAARAPVVVTLDGDGQNDPAFIPAMLRALEAGAPRVGLVAGQRVGRKASGFKKLQSRIANGVRGAVLRDGTRDTGCGLKAFRRDVFLRAALFRRPAPVPAGAGPARGLRHRLCRRGRPAARRRRLELRPVGPAVGRHPRSRRRVVADPPQEARSGSLGGLNADRYRARRRRLSARRVHRQCRLGNPDRLRRADSCSPCASWCSGSPPSAPAGAWCRRRSGCSRSAAG